MRILVALTLCIFYFNGFAAAEDWQELFNGRDLTGWHPVGGPADNRAANEGVLACNGKPGALWLATDDQYGDFELALEFIVPENGNSGVFICAPEEGAPWVMGMEIQVLDDYGDKFQECRFQCSGFRKREL